jgi:hypothetical protein
MDLYQKALLLTLQELADKRVNSNDFGKLAAPKSRNNSFELISAFRHL